METNYASVKVKEDARSQTLLDSLEDWEQDLEIDGGVLYYDFPLFRDTDGLYRSQVLMACRSHGLFLFSVGALNDRTWQEGLPDLDDRLAQLYSLVLGRLLRSKTLRASVREIQVPMCGIVYLPDVVDARNKIAQGRYQNQVLCNLPSVKETIKHAKMDIPLTGDQWKELRALLEGSKGLMRPKERDAEEGLPADSKGALLRSLEAEVANFDASQRSAAITIVEGPQRVRGLAGSGKTIVLAMKAAHLHLNDPTSTILLTFYTKSLYGFLKRMVTRFYRQYNDQDPDWTKVHILHAWGGRTMEGVYYNACLDTNVPSLPLKQVPAGARNRFAYVCDDLLKKGSVQQKYDYVLMDEAQDFPPEFFRLCFELTRGGRCDRNIVWAYDELQNIMNTQMPLLKDLFGTFPGTTTPRMDLERAAAAYQFGSRDIVLHKCYRNPREVLLTAHALGFGIYSDTIVQMLENCDHWRDVGYTIEEGDCREDQHTRILRPENNSPLSISSKQRPDQIVTCFAAESFQAEIRWVVEQIQGVLKDGLRPDDILVVCLDDTNARSYFQALAIELTTVGISVNNTLANPYSTPQFTVEDHVTLTTVYRAKGNEAAVVFAVGVEAIYPSRKLQKGRNMLFTAFTRTKAWLMVSGIGDGAAGFFEEIKVSLQHFPYLVFTYPDPEKVIRLQRDLSDREAKLKRVREFVDQLDFDLREDDFMTLLTHQTPVKKKL